MGMYMVLASPGGARGVPSIRIERPRGIDLSRSVDPVNASKTREHPPMSLLARVAGMLALSCLAALLLLPYGVWQDASSYL